MRRTLALLCVLAAAAVVVAPAAGAIFIRLTTIDAHRGQVVRMVGDAAHMPLYALPLRDMPCATLGTCVGPFHRHERPSRSPYVFLGYTPGVTVGMVRPHAFLVRLPRAMRIGTYVVFVWCASCGGSLINAAADASGQPQTLEVIR
jgi:hypothetical protein